jgi:hypothetical protein
VAAVEPDVGMRRPARPAYTVGAPRAPASAEAAPAEAALSEAVAAEPAKLASVELDGGAASHERDDKLAATLAPEAPKSPNQPAPYGAPTLDQLTAPCAYAAPEHRGGVVVMTCR